VVWQAKRSINAEAADKEALRVAKKYVAVILDLKRDILDKVQNRWSPLQLGKGSG
jgi:hypothetical protein